MVVTSHDKLGDTGRKTGFWLQEFAAPYYVYKDGGAQITIASPKGGQPPLDPSSDGEGPHAASSTWIRRPLRCWRRESVLFIGTQFSIEARHACIRLGFALSTVWEYVGMLLD
jgi:putative intracellular protease/amidase